MTEGINIFLKRYTHLDIVLGNNSDHPCKPTKYLGWSIVQLVDALWSE